MRARLTIERLEDRDLLAAKVTTLPVMPFADAAALDHARAIFARGQELGRNAAVFLKAGDSNTAGPTPIPFPYLAPFGAANYDPNRSGLAARAPELLDTLAVYRGGINSFARSSTAAYPGWRAADVLNHLAGEVAATDAAVALIMIGTNDAATGTDASVFRAQLSAIVTTLINRGVVPILSTIPDIDPVAGDFRGRVKQFNQIIADVADRSNVPLWNFWRAERRLPNQGLVADGVHLNVSPNGGANLSAVDLQFGQNVRNFQALKILDWFRHGVVSGSTTYVAPISKWRAMEDGRPLYSVGRDVGYSPTVDVYNARTGKLVNRFLAFDRSFGGGVRVATGDVNDDGYADVVCATGAGTTATVRVFSGKNGDMIAQRVPFDTGYTGGLSVAVGDVDGDGIADVVVGRSAGSSGVRVYSGDSFSLVSSFEAFPGLNAGADVAVANVAGVGPVVVVGSSVSPVVRLFNPDGTLADSFPVFGDEGGITVTAADLNGDGFDELAVARATDSNRVWVVDPITHDRRAGYTAAPVIDASYGLQLGTLRSPVGRDTVLVGSGAGSSVSLVGFSKLSGKAKRLPPSNADRAYGIFVG